MLSKILPLLAVASTASALALEPRQDASSIQNHANSATLGLLAPGYTGFFWPESRGYNRTSHREFCGGFPVGTTRENFSISGGKISLVQQKAVSDVQLMYSTVENPTSLSDFIVAADNSTMLGVGLSCVQAPDFASMGLGAGTSITFYIEYTYGSHQYQYNQCADVSLVDPSNFSDKVMCVNAMVSQADADLMSNGTIEVATQQWTESGFTSFPSGLSAAAGGGIGAGVTLAVIGAVFAGLFSLGRMSVGKKRCTGSPEMSSNDSGSSFRQEKV